MKLIRIIEKDEKYAAELAERLIALHAGEATEDARVMQMPDDFDHDTYWGMAPYTTPQAVPAPVKAWLESYSGDFEFYLSVKAQLAAKGSLSPKQIAAIERAIARDADYAAKKQQQQAQQYSYKPGQVLIVGKFHARRIALEAGYAHPHHALKVLEVHRETERAVLVTIELTAQRTAFCGCCGLTLTNPASIAAGIGPICAEKTGLSSMSLSALGEALRGSHAIQTWIPKSSIKSIADEEALEKVS